MLSRAVLLVLLAAPLGCAHSSPPPTAEPPRRPPFRSSIAAVLAHRQELSLTDGQLQQLTAIDDRLNAQLAEIHAHAPRASRKVAAGGSRPDARPGDGRDAQGEPLPGAAGDPSAGRGVGRGGRMGGMGGGRHRAEGASDASPPRTRADELADDADSKAFAEAEAALTDEQRPRAREFAEQFREALYDWRQAMRSRKRPDASREEKSPE